MAILWCGSAPTPAPAGSIMAPHPRVTIPGTDLSVSPICLGAAQFGTGLSEDAAYAILDAFAEAGGNMVDTAHVYNDFAPGAERSLSEKVLGRWRRARRDDTLLITTKGGHPQIDNIEVKRITLRDLRQDVVEALGYLGYSQLPLFTLHRDDPALPAGEILGFLEEFRREGLIRHYGASNWQTPRLAEAHEAARRLGYQGFATNQTEWSLARRNPGTAPGTSMDLSVMDDEMIAFHTRTGLAATAYWSQSKGYFDKLLSGRMDAEAARCYESPLSRAIADVLLPVAAKLGATPTQTMLAAQMRAPFLTIPIAGCRSPAQVASSMASLDVRISAEDVSALYAAARFTLGRPRPD